MVASDATAQDLAESARESAVAKAKNALVVLSVFFATMSLGVWYVFRKRGRIYI
jgi:cytochrome oxidase assembly protein ShyY1